MPLHKSISKGVCIIKEGERMYHALDMNKDTMTGSFKDPEVLEAMIQDGKVEWKPILGVRTLKRTSKYSIMGNEKEGWRGVHLKRSARTDKYADPKELEQGIEDGTIPFRYSEEFVSTYPEDAKSAYEAWTICRKGNAFYARKRGKERTMCFPDKDALIAALENGLGTEREERKKLKEQESVKKQRNIWTDSIWK